MTALPERMNEVQRFLATTEDVQAIARLHDLAEAARRYAESHEKQNYAAEVKLRCARRAGELLATADIGPGKKSLTLRDFNLGHNESHRWQRMALVSDEVFEEFIRKSEEITAAGLLRLVKDQERAERDAEKAARAAEHVDLDTDASWVSVGDFRDLKLEPGSVDLVFTDPPYPQEFLPLWSDLAELSAKWLKPGALLVAYTGPYHLPEVIHRLSKHLDYWWCGAVVHDGAWTQIKSRRLNTGWKPVLMFRNGPGDVLPWLNRDVVTEGHREKDGHEWQQALLEAEHFIGQLTRKVDFVVDPFLGSGTTAVACRNLGRFFIGRDVDPVAVGTTLERLQSDV